MKPKENLFLISFIMFFILPISLFAKDDVVVHGSVQTDILFPEKDETIATENYDQKILFNTYADASLISRYIDAGLRFEFMKWPLPGYEPDFSGWGIPNIYVKGKFKGVTLTVGDFYEQFGSGFILRTYEERSLGIDNSLRGVRLNVNPTRGLRLTALGGLQRDYWNWRKESRVYGANVEMDATELFHRLKDRDFSLNFGASYVLKHEDDEMIVVPGENYRLNLPENVNAFDLRGDFKKGGWNILAEFAWKGQDPSFDNHYTYGNGTAIMLNGTYSVKGFSVMVNTKRSENMAFRSQRSANGLSAFINNMPAFTYQHTYALPSLYPYATQSAPGEWAFEGLLSYNFKKKTLLGGKYGTKINLNLSYISGLVGKGDISDDVKELMGTNGNQTSFFKIGKCNYYDFNIQVEKRFSAPFTMQFMYMNQYYNNEVLKTLESDDTSWVRANILVAEGKYRFNKKYTLRGELQYLFSKQDQKDWAYGQLELSYSPYLMLSVSDLWNCGDTKIHYYMIGLTGNYKSNRLTLSYGRTRKGYNCTGGVCRLVPAMRGLQVSYNYYF